MAELFLFKEHTVTEILNENESAKHYIAGAANGGDCYLVQEFYDRAAINMFMADFIGLNKDRVPEFAECFSENSTFCVVFKYTKGVPLPGFLEKENLAFEYRLLMAKNIMLKLMELESAPLIIQTTVLMPSNIVIVEGSIFLNFSVDLSMLRRPEISDVYYSIAALLDELFTYGEIKGNNRLKIISEKCKKNIYGSFGEIMKDLDNLSKAEAKNLDLKAVITEKKKRLMSTAGNIAAVLVLLAGLAALYNEYIVKSREGVLTFSPVEEIGNVHIETDTPEAGELTANTEDAKKIIEVAGTYETKAQEEEPPLIHDEIFEDTAQEAVSADEIINTPEPEYTSYFVKPGDNLSKICKEHYGSIAELNKVIEYNNLQNPNLLRTGWEIKLPLK